MLKHGKAQLAIKWLLRAQAKDKRNALVYYNLGLAHEQVKRYTRAISCYRRAVLHDPTLLDAAVCLGYLYGVRGDQKRELGCYEEVLRRDPRHAVALYNKAVTLHDDLENPKAAIQWYHAVLQVPLTRQQQNDVYWRLVYAYLDTQQYGKADKSLHTLIRRIKAYPKNRSSGDIYGNRRSVKRKRG